MTFAWSAAIFLTPEKYDAWEPTHEFPVYALCQGKPFEECYLCVLLLARGGNGRFPCSVQAIARTMTVYRGTIFVSRMSSNMWMYDLIL